MIAESCSYAMRPSSDWRFLNLEAETVVLMLDCVYQVIGPSFVHGA